MVDINPNDNILNTGFTFKLQNRGAKSTGLTFELKSVFEEMAKKGLIKDKDGDGLSKQESWNLYKKLNELHQASGKSTDYHKMREGQEFTYSQSDLQQLLEASGYEILASQEELKEEPIEQQLSEPPVEGEAESSSEETVQNSRFDFGNFSAIPPTIQKLDVNLSVPKDIILAQPDLSMNEILPITDEDLSGSEVVNTEPLAEDNSTDAEAENIASGVVKDENLSAVSDEKKSSQTPEADVNNEEPLTAERISEKVKQLKVGEEFTYVTTQSFAWGSGRSVEKKTYTWQRNEDGTLTCTQPEVVHSSFGQVVQSAKTVYSSDKQRMISRDMAGVAMNLGLLSTQNFDENGKITSVTTDLTQMNTEGYSSNAVHFLHRVSSESRHPFNYKQQEFCNKDGDIILSCKEGKFYNAKGKEIDVVDATKILRKAEYKQKIGQLIQYPS